LQLIYGIIPEVWDLARLRTDKVTCNKIIGNGAIR